MSLTSRILSFLALASLAIAQPPASQPARMAHERPAEGKVLEVALHELGNFDYNEENDDTIPADVRKLDGVRVRIPGQMLPIDSAARVTQFLLVNDLMSCCFGQMPKLQNVAMCKLPEGSWISATGERILVEGVLRVSVQKDDGFVTSIFQIDCTSIKMAPQ